MIRITRLADYGIVLMTAFAAEPERLCAAPELAAGARLPLPMVSKVLKRLAREGLLHSQRGVHGGYALARDPREISVAEIITALEGPIAVTECIADGPGECVQERICPVRGNWQHINRAIRGALEQITLAEMVRPLPDPLVSLGRGHTVAAAR